MKRVTERQKGMPRLNAVVNHEVYQTYYKRICECETDRVFCCHQMNHLLDVARIAYIKNLEEGLGFDKELIYVAAVLHDIGKSFQYRQQIPHEIAGERIARRILDSLPTGFTFTDEEKALICLAVRGHRRRHEHMKPIEELFYESDKRSRMCLSCMAENDCAEQVIGVSFDGTGYGTDGTIWGGEILLSDLNGFERAGSVMPFLQIGGDASSKEGWRIAVSLLYGMTGDREKTSEIIEKLELCTKQEANVQFAMADRRINAVMSTSAGRLFDGVSAILGIRRKSTFEGEASMALEFAAEEYQKNRLKNAKKMPEIPTYELLKEGNDRLLLNTGSLLKEILDRRLNGEDPGSLAYIFHQELARQITASCVKIREQSGCNKAALSGGVFQNRLLLELTDHMLKQQGFEVLKHQLVPPNDGGIALGQAVYAMAYLDRNK